MNKRRLSILKSVLSIALFCGAVYFENAQPQRLILLVALFLAFMADGFVRGLMKQESRYFYLSFYFDIAFTFLLEQNSRLLINYFFHSFYIIILLEAVLSLNLRKGITFGAVAVIASLIKYGYLIYYKYNFANISQMAFFLLVNVLILVIAGFAQHNREERQRKDILYQELLETHRKLRQYTDEVNRLSVVEERNRIARDIHDTLGHNMTALIMQLQMTEHLFKEDPARSRELLSSAVSTARDSLTGIREVIETLRGEDSLKYSIDAIRTLVKDFADKTSVEIQLDITGEQGDPSLHQRSNLRFSAANMALYRIIQESLTNAVRHGKATKIYVKINNLEKEIRFSVHDNGDSVDANDCGEQENITSSERDNGIITIREGYGLRGIRERVEAFGGQMLYQADQGFTVQGVLYLEDQNDKDTVG